jgi:oligoendopeptidase F
MPLKLLMILFTFSVLQARSESMPTRSQMPVEDQWNVAAIYSSWTEWKKDFDRLKGDAEMPHWPQLKSHAGKLNDPSQTADFFRSFMKLDQELSKLFTYAHLRLDEDLSSDLSKQNYGSIVSLLYDFQLEYSWVEPELLSLSQKDFERLVNSDQLKEYRFYFEKIGRQRPHVLSKELEAMLAMSGKAMETPTRAFGALNNVDMTFDPAVSSDGEKNDLTTGTYNVYLKSPDRELRKSAFINLHKAYQAHANTLCELIQGQVQNHLFAARARKFSTCQEAALFPNHVDRKVYENLLAVIHEHLPAMHDYLRLRKEVLKLDELHPYDLYVPLVEEVQQETPYDEACRVVIESVKPLGDSYQQTLKRGLTEDRWVDPFENQFKRSGGYSSGCYGTMPYILMNYHGSISDVFTLAHEAGHSMHSFLSRKNQPYIYADYPIFVAEVASTFNEQLLLKSLKDSAVSKKDLAYLINYEIEAIRTTIFRQALFAEFELKIHTLTEQGETLTPALLKEIYLDLNRQYYGPDLVLDGGIEYEWTRIPHFYYNFYVYQYSTGLSAALALFEKVNQSEKDRDRYLQFLSSGGSRYPLDLLKVAGVDLREKAPIESAMKKFELRLKELKKILAEI